MATKSFLKNVTIKTKKQCQLLADALENAKNKKAKLVVLTCKSRTATTEDIRAIFGSSTCQK